MGDIVPLVDAITADLELLPLAKHRVWKYVEPPVLNMTSGTPLLAVYAAKTEFEPIGTPEPAYESDDLVRVDWFEPTGVSVETGGVGSDAAAATAMKARDLIVARIRDGYGEAVPGLPGQSEATLVKAEYGIVDGGLAYLVRVEFKVCRWP